MTTFFLLLINLGISWWNCYAVGGVWAESKAIGGFSRVLAWSGAIQSAIGFSMVIGAIELAILNMTGHLPPRVLHGAMSLWYLLIILPCLGSGLAITVQSWIALYRERSLANLGVTAWNTYAQVSNMYHAVSSIPEAFSGITSLFKGSDDDDDSPAFAIVIALVGISLLGGILITQALIKRYSGRLPEVQRNGAAA